MSNPNSVSIVPPWSHDDAVSYSPEGRSSFRSIHDLENKFVVMYSGNHSPCHPLDTLLNAALVMSKQNRYAFCFVGGGSEQSKVRDFAKLHRLDNILCLPYQPMEKLSGSLSAADLHVVVLGEKFVGIVHPSKIYNILNIDVPVLYIGPQQSHVMDLAADLGPNYLFTAQHGDVDGVAQRISEAARISSARNHETQSTVAARFSRHALLPQMMSLLEFDHLNDPSILQATQQPSVKAQ